MSVGAEGPPPGVLLIDDDAVLLDVLAEVFAAERYRVACVSDLAAAVAVLAEQRFAAIVTDTMTSPWNASLPAIGQLRKAAPATPIVLFTGYAEAAELDLEEAGLAAVWHKPVDLDEVLRSLQGVLRADPTGRSGS